MAPACCTYFIRLTAAHVPFWCVERATDGEVGGGRSPVLHYDHDSDLLWLFYTHSTVCSSLFAFIKALRYAPGGDIRVRSKRRVWLVSIRACR